MRSQAEIEKILRVLDREYPRAACTLDHRNTFELLVATILAAQCTDERVNQVTRDLFQKYRSPADLAAVDIAELEQDIRPTGFFRNKAKNIKLMSQTLVIEYHGRVPDNLEALISLPGIGRKTANVVLGTGYNRPAMVVDTHVSRFSSRMGLSGHQDPVKIEFDLMKQIPEDRWVIFGHQVIEHGRKICQARKPDCDACPLLALCPTGMKK